MAEGVPESLNLGGSEATDDKAVLPPARRDVEITEQVYYGKPCYVLKDPASLRYYRLRPPEYTIYQMLDGDCTMEQILRTLAQRYPDEEYDQQSVMSFMVMLRSANLLVVSGESSAEYLLQRKKLLTRGFFKRLRTEFLFYRIPILDPDRLLDGMRGTIGPLIFNRFTAVLVWLVLIGAVAVVISSVDKLALRQPLLSWINLLYLAPALFVIKIIHEFGHGLAAKHFGSEVHEMGLMFLVFMPMMYCDVSDAWMLSEKRKRMWITAAGIVVEITLAALAAYVWHVTEPKTVINQFALNVMFVASINTLLFNGNPLLRYDGYYFMMDLVEIPNLKQKGNGYLWYLFQRYVLGLDRAPQPIDVQGREPGVLGYAICSAVYRWFIMAAIVTTLWTMLEPKGWGVLGAIMALGCIYNAFVAPIGKFVKFVFGQRHHIHIRVAAAVALIVVVGGCIYGFLLLPTEDSREAQCVVRPAQAQRLYVVQPGFVPLEPAEGFVKDGDRVKAGEVLLTLSEPELEHEVRDLGLELRQKEIAWKTEVASGAAGQSSAEQIKAEVEGLRARYERAQANRDKLRLVAPLDGVVQVHTNRPLAQLQGSYLPLQAPVFTVYAPDRFEAVAAVNHRQYGAIEVGQAVEIRLWALDGETFETKVEVKPPQPVRVMSSPAFSTAFGGEVETIATSAEEAMEPAVNTYEIVLPITGLQSRLRDGMVGRAKIILEKKSLGRAAYLWLITTLKQDLRL